MAKPHRVVAVAYNNLCLFEFGIACELFGLPRPELDVEWYNFKVCTTSRTALTALGGVQVNASHTLKLLDHADTIVIPGWAQTEATSQLTGKLVRAHERGARIVAICSGAFLLGAAGLLDGRRATTHWRYIDELQARYPKAEVVPDILYVGQDGVFTSAGSAAGIDLCLHLVRSDYGARIANAVARRLVLPAHRAGGQAQFVRSPVIAEHSSLSELLDWIRDHLNEAHSVASLAERANCSQRSLLRRFRTITGCSPVQWITAQRIELAKQLLEETAAPIGVVAERSGFVTAETLRHHFRRAVGVSPRTYRRAFNATLDHVESF